MSNISREGSRGDAPLFAVVYVPSGAKETRVHWPPVRVSARAYARTKKREKGFWSRRERGSSEGEKEREKEKKKDKEKKREKESEERGAKVTRGKKAAREEFGEHYSPAVSLDRWISAALILFLPRIPIQGKTM